MAVHAKTLACKRTWQAVSLTFPLRRTAWKAKSPKLYSPVLQKVAPNHGQLSITSGLLKGMVAYDFGLLRSVTAWLVVSSPSLLSTNGSLVCQGRSP